MNSFYVVQQVLGFKGPVSFGSCVTTTPIFDKFDKIINHK